MATFKHEVPAEVREASTWNDVYVCYDTPDGRHWIYSDDPEHAGVSWQANGEPISVAIWIDDEDKDA